MNAHDLGGAQLLDLLLVHELQLLRGRVGLGVVEIVHLVVADEVGDSAVGLAVDVVAFDARNESQVARNLVLRRVLVHLHRRLRVKALLRHVARVSRNLGVL